MARSCPISFKEIDGTIARINAMFITLLIVTFFITAYTSILYFLVIDLGVRLFGYYNFSLIFNFSKLVKKIFFLKTKMTDAGAKRLATFFGLFFVLLMSVLSNFHFDNALYITGIILLICSSLEMLFNYCLGCEIYHIYQKIKLTFLKVIMQKR